MEPIRPRKESQGSNRRSGSGSVHSERSSSRASSKKSDHIERKLNRDQPIAGEKEVKFDAEENTFQEGFILEGTCSEDSDLELGFEKDAKAGYTESSDVAGIQDLEPYMDEEAMKAELGGDPEEAVSVVETAHKTDEADESKETKTTEEDEEEPEVVKSKGKKGRKLKKKTEKRTAFDGRETVFVTEFTQTDWRWKDSVERSGRGMVITPTSELEVQSKSSLKSILVKPDLRDTTSRALTEEESTMDDRTGTDLTPFSLQPNDEFGIPMLDMSSDSDSSEDDAPKRSRAHKHHLPSIGPPQILKYVRESDHTDQLTEKTSSDMDYEDDHLTDSTNPVLDQYGNHAGMFSGPCEFCEEEIKPFPTLEQQLSQPPESLYCCEEYREFVEFAMTTADRLEENVAKQNEKINVKVHAHHGSKQARKMAKEQAVQRMRERELQRRQQEATGIQAAFYQSNEHDERLPAGDDVDGHRKTMGGRDGGGVGADGDSAGVEGGGGLKREIHASKGGAEVKHGGGGGGRGGEGGGGRTDRSKGGGHGSHLPPIHAQATASFSSYGGINAEVARQMKTINYQLSSQKCFEEGWTLRAPSPLDLDDLDNEVFIPEPLHPAMIASGKLHDRKLVEKFYPDGSKFLTIFPDGTGNVFYPSGRPAIMIISIALGQYTYVVQDDATDPEILAVFEPNGYGCCYFANGKVRLTYDQIEGLELDYTGGRKRSWNWKDQETHVHAPPFQPIVFGMNRYIGVRFLAQESIALTLTGRKRSCRFNVGSKLKLVAPENIQPKGIDENQLFIDERKVKVDRILNKVTTLLKFPKSPKVDRILPPLAVSARQHKVDKMREEYAASLAVPSATPGRKSRKIAQPNRLSPLPVVSVN